jgi:hypothetical protein
MSCKCCVVCSNLAARATFCKHNHAHYRCNLDMCHFPVITHVTKLLHCLLT